MAYLASWTEGLFFHNNNDLAGGMREMMDDLSGYYLIGYKPAISTFTEDKAGRGYHHIRGEGEGARPAGSHRGRASMEFPTATSARLIARGKSSCWPLPSLPSAHRECESSLRRSSCAEGARTPWRVSGCTSMRATSLSRMHPAVIRTARPIWWRSPLVITAQWKVGREIHSGARSNPRSSRRGASAAWTPGSIFPLGSRAVTRCAWRWAMRARRSSAPRASSSRSLICGRTGSPSRGSSSTPSPGRERSGRAPIQGRRTR